MYNEFGELIYTASAAVAAATSTTLGTGFVWKPVAAVFKTFGGINTLLTTLMPIVSFAGFLGISGITLWKSTQGAGSLGGAVMTSIITLVAIVISLEIAPRIFEGLIDANSVITSGQFEVNGGFGNILTLIMGLFPVIYIAGLVSIVGIQAKTALQS